jgi:hypothetical protein
MRLIGWRSPVSEPNPLRARPRRSVILGLVLVAAGALLGYLAASGATGSGAARPEAAASPVKVALRPATGSETAASSSKLLTKGLLRRQTVKTRVSRHAIMTGPGKGAFVGLTCPRGYVALSGGAVTGFNDLLISHSAPVKPTGRQRYTPRTWWVAVTNIQSNNGADPLPWHPLVNCVNKIRVGS